MGLLTDVHGRGVFSSRPAAGHAGREYFATDTSVVYRDNGSSWDAQGTAGYVPGGTDVAVADGGTGASSATAARTNLGLVLGTDVASLTGGRVPIAQLASGTPDGTKFIRDDGVLATPAGGGGGSDLVQTYSGGGSVYIPGLRGSVDRIPASPSAFDDEFNALSGWTTLGSPATSNVTDLPSHLHLVSSASLGMHGLYKTAPSMPFTVTAKITARSHTANFQGAGLLLTEASPGKIACLTPFFNSSFGAGVIDTGWQTWATNTTGRSGVDVSQTWWPAGILTTVYVRMFVHSSSNIDTFVSTDGLIWIAQATAQNSGLTVANVGLVVGDIAATVASEAYFDWIRFS